MSIAHSFGKFWTKHIRFVFHWAEPPDLTSVTFFVQFSEELSSNFPAFFLPNSVIMSSAANAHRLCTLECDSHPSHWDLQLKQHRLLGALIFKGLHFALVLLLLYSTFNEVLHPFLFLFTFFPYIIFGRREGLVLYSVFFMRNYVFAAYSRKPTCTQTHSFRHWCHWELWVTELWEGGTKHPLLANCKYAEAIEPWSDQPPKTIEGLCQSHFPWFSSTL